jgi:hypothetical protein
MQLVPLASTHPPGPAGLVAPSGIRGAKCESEFRAAPSDSESNVSMVDLGCLRWS